MERPLSVRLLRISLAILALLVAAALPNAPWMVPVIAGAVIAYEGPSSRSVRWLIGGLFVAELSGLAAPGAWSLPTAVTALAWSLVVRVVPVTPWASREGWHPLDYATAVLAAALLAGSVALGAVLVATVAGAHEAGIRAASIFAAWWPAVPLAAMLALVLLRRIDTPFRQRIRFGS